MRNRIEPDDFARQEETQHLLAPFAVVDVGLDRADAHGGDGLEGIAFAEDVLALGEWPDVRHQHVQFFAACDLSKPCSRQAAENAQVLQNRNSSPSSAIGLDPVRAVVHLSRARLARRARRQSTREWRGIVSAYGRCRR